MMNTSISFGKLLLFPCVGMLAGAASNSTLVDASTNIPISVAVAVAATCASTSWWLAKQFTRLGDRLKIIENQMKVLKCIREECPIESSNED